MHRCLVSQIDFNSDTKTSGKDFHQTKLLKECFVSYFNKPNYPSILNFAFESSTQFQQSFKFQQSNLVTQINKLLKLNQLQEIALSIFLKQCAFEEVKTAAQTFLKQKLAELIDLLEAESAKDSLNLSELSIELTHQIYAELENLSQQQENSPSHNWQTHFEDLLPSNIQHIFNLQKDFQKGLATPREDTFRDIELIQNLKMENSLMDYVQEIGYGFTSSPEECRGALQSFNPAIKDMLNPLNVAKVLGLMARTHNNLNADWQYQGDAESSPSQTTWSSEVFALAVHELAPKLDWKSVVKEFDHAEFIIRDRVALKLVVQAIKRVLRDPFPIELIYRTWKNSEGQVGA